MMYQEFMEIAGYEVSVEDYNNIIEPMYLALSDVTKQDFVKMIDKKRFALPTKKQIVNQMKKLAKHLQETCEYYTDYEAKDNLEKLAKIYAKRFYNIDWNNDIKSYIYFNDEHTNKEYKRGCTYPLELVIGRNNRDYERLTLI